MCIRDSVYGLDKYKVEFEAIINEKALDSDIGNQAIAFGYDPEHKPENKPSSKDPLPNADSESGVLFEEKMCIRDRLYLYWIW